MRINPFEVGFWLMIIGIPCSRAITEIGATLLIVSWVIQKLQSRDFSFKNSSLLLPLGIFVLWSGLSLVWTFDQALSSRSFLSQTLEYAAIYLAVSDGFCDKKMLRRVLWFWSAWGLLMFADGAIQLIRGTDLIRGYAPGLIAGGERITAAMKYPNDFGAYAALTALMSAALGLAEWNEKRIVRSCIAWTIASAMTLGLLLTYSRGAWIGFGFSLLVVMMLYRTRYAIPLLVAAGAFIAFLPASYLERVLHLFEMHPGSSGDERLLVWKTALTMIREHPWTGFGLNTFNSVFPIFKDASIWGTPYAHNCFLQMTTELGLVGLALFGWLLIRVFQQGWRDDQPSTWERTVALALIAAAAGFSIHSSTDTNWYSLPLAVMWWSTLGLIDALHGINVDRQRLFDRQIHKIIAVRTDRLGDVLMNLPAIHALKLRYPKAVLEVAVRPPIDGLLQKQRFLDQVKTIPIDPARRRWTDVIRLALWLRSRRADAIVVLNPLRSVHTAAFLAGIPIRVGYARKWGFLLTDTLADQKAAGHKHEVDYNLDLVQLLGVASADRAPELYVEEQEEAAILQRMEKAGIDLTKPIVAVHPWTSDTEKQWPLSYMAQLITELTKDRSSTLVLIGGPEEQVHAQHFLAGLPSPVLSWVGQLSLRELAAFLKQSAVLVSNDSGPVHVSAAVGTPTVTLFTGRRIGATPKRWGPIGEGHIILQNPHPEVPISVETVVAAVREQLSKPRAQIL